MTPPVFFAADVATLDLTRPVVLAGAEGRHAADVRRLREGERVQLTDGSGTLLHGTVVGVRRGEVAVEVAERERVPPAEPRLVVAQALARGGRDEAAIEAMTEVGLDEVLGWQASRSVARWTDRTAAKWESTVRAAAKQSRRAWWPTVSAPVTTEQLAQRCAAATAAFVLHESAQRPLTSSVVPGSGSVLVVVGPEGGISDAELEQLTRSGAVAVRLGTTILRSSTAGVAALSVICGATRWRET